MKFEKSNPILYSTDIKNSIKYYIEKLGFADSWVWGDTPDFGGVVKDNVEIFFCLMEQGKPGYWLTIVLDDVDEYYHSIKDKGAKILAAPENMQWSMREMLVEDPDGHIIRFGHRIECD